MADGATAGPCSNEAVRTGPSAALPDCRAYEMVSPPNFEPRVARGNENQVEGVQAAVEGDAVAFYSYQGAPAGTYLPGSPSAGQYFLSRRAPLGWAKNTEDVIPPQSTIGERTCYPWIVYSPDLSKGALQDGWNWGEGYPTYPDDNNCANGGHDEPALVKTEPRGALNLFVRDNATHAYELVNEAKAGVPARDAWFQAGSADFSHIVFTDPIPLTSEAPVPPEEAPAFFEVGEDLYDWTNVGGAHLVTILPREGKPLGKAVEGLLANSAESDRIAASETWTHAVSTDGERVYFYAEGTLIPRSGYTGAKLYLRENAAKPRTEECADSTRACTVEVDANQGGPDESGGGRFEWASADGAIALFTDERKLTSESKAQAGKPDLYEYSVARPPGERLVDLTGTASEPANVQGLSGISDDGAYVYFVAEGKLTGNQANSQHEVAQAGKPNLYVRHGGIDTFIARLDGLNEDVPPGAAGPEANGDVCNWDSFTPFGQEDPIRPTEFGNCMAARVTPTGAFLAFESRRRLTGYNNVVSATGYVNKEIFLYEAATNQLTCASCDPSGAPPMAALSEDPRIPPPMKNYPTHNSPSYLTRALAGDGNVFFSTRNSLVPAATNGMQNVYEYSNGRLSLISSGKSPENSVFLDASANGNDVFFGTTEALVGADTDNAMSLYDARVGGGFSEPPPPAAACESEEACRGVVSGAAGAASPLTATFVGPGNIVASVPRPEGPSCKRGFGLVTRHGKRICVVLCRKGGVVVRSRGKRVCKPASGRPLHGKRGSRR